jgi:hypothetical protein
MCEVAWHMFTATTAYTVNLTAVSLVAIGCTGLLSLNTGKTIEKSFSNLLQFNNPVFMGLLACFQNDILKL